MGIESNLTGMPTFSRLEIVKTGKATITKQASQTVGSEVVTHNLGYIPVVICFTEDDAGLLYPFPYAFAIESGTGAGGVQTNTYFKITSTTITFYFQTPNFSGSPSYGADIETTVRYYLLRERSD